MLFFAGGLAGVEDQVVGFRGCFVWEELAEEPEDTLGLGVLGCVRFCIEKTGSVCGQWDVPCAREVLCTSTLNLIFWISLRRSLYQLFSVTLVFYPRRWHI